MVRIKIPLVNWKKNPLETSVAQKLKDFFQEHLGVEKTDANVRAFQITVQHGRLSVQETVVLRCLMYGYSIEEISRASGYTEATVSKLKQSLLEKSREFF